MTALDEYAMQEQLHGHQSKANSSQIQKLLRKGDSQSKSDAAALIQEQQELEPSEPAGIRHLANDSTVEKLADFIVPKLSI